ncbi:MAG: nucleotidyltransferase family protein [Chloroflexi bacterium]|nr:nucleotidyltransferase family protein [Chloroflexota bacterium]
MIHKAMILAAGQGSRLRALESAVPKPMVSIAGRPLIEHTVEWLAVTGFRQIVVNLHHQPEAIREHLGDGTRWSVQIRYSHEKTLLGTAGGVKAMEWFFDDTFLVWYGDNLCQPDLVHMAAYHRAKGGIATVALHHRPDATTSGIVELDDDGRIRRFLEKPSPGDVFSDIVNAGIYILEPEVFEHIPPGVPSDFGRQVFPSLLDRGEKMYGYLLTTPLYWVDTPADYERTQQAFAKGGLKR